MIDKIKWVKEELRTGCESLLDFSDKDKVVALIIRRGIDDKWATVGVTAYTESGAWIDGMILITSIDDVLDTAEKHNLNIIFEKTLLEVSNGTQKSSG